MIHYYFEVLHGISFSEWGHIIWGELAFKSYRDFSKKSIFAKNSAYWYPNTFQQRVA